MECLRDLVLLLLLPLSEPEGSRETSAKLGLWPLILINTPEEYHRYYATKRLGRTIGVGTILSDISSIK